MRRILLNSLVFSSISLLGAGAAMAQAGGQSPGQSPSTPQSPSSRPMSPNMNGPAGPGSAENPDATTMTRKVDDNKFVKDAAMGGMAEVELGKLATQKGSSDAVKQFGQKMVDDHTKANDQLKEIASKENISTPIRLTRSINRALRNCPNCLDQRSIRRTPRTRSKIIRRMWASSRAKRKTARTPASSSSHRRRCRLCKSI